VAAAPVGPFGVEFRSVDKKCRSWTYEKGPNDTGEREKRGKERAKEERDTGAAQEKKEREGARPNKERNHIIAEIETVGVEEEEERGRILLHLIFN
jgi:hypothetical protein